VAELNSEWALNELRAFVEMTRLVTPPPTPGVAFFGDDRRPASSNAQIVPAAQVVEKILARVTPRWQRTVPPSARHHWEQHHQAALRAIAELERADEVREMLGDDAPTLYVSTLHPWVWEGARSMWSSGHFRQSVFDAGKRVNAEGQNKYGTRDLTEADLFTQAFSDNAPTANRPRFRLPEDDDGKTARSLRRGIREYASGCFAAIRNPQGHDEQQEIPEHEAIEQLAAFSILARWVDRSAVVTDP
jgi:hypothetical protein